MCKFARVKLRIRGQYEVLSPTNFTACFDLFVTLAKWIFGGHTLSFLDRSKEKNLTASDTKSMMNSGDPHG